MAKIMKTEYLGGHHPLKRRDLLKLTLGSVLSCGVAQGTPHFNRATWRIPGGYEPGSRIWVGFDLGHLAVSIRILRVLQKEKVPIGIWVSSLSAKQECAIHLEQAGLDVQSVKWEQSAGVFFFLRDATVFTQCSDGTPGAIDFRWSHYGTAGWCAQRYAQSECTPAFDATLEQLDAAMGRALQKQAIVQGSKQHSALGRAMSQDEEGIFHSDIALEGGALESNGEGTLIANEAFLMQRNAHRSREQLESSLLQLPGVLHVIWVKEGLAEDPQMRATITSDFVGWGTGGHTDEFVRFANPNTVLLAWPSDEDAQEHPVSAITRQRMQKNLLLLQESCTAKGEPLHVIKVPHPRPIERTVQLREDANTHWSEQWRAADFLPIENRKDGSFVRQVAVASYLNFVVAHGLILLPDYRPYGTPWERQQEVKKIFEQIFVGKKVIFIDALELNWYGGGLHCATLNEP